MGNVPVKKQIAILSMQRVVNFGSVLQAYSLREMICELTGTPACFMDIDKAHILPSNKSVPESADYEALAHYPPGIVQRGKRWIIARLSSYNKRLIRRFMEKELKLDETQPGYVDTVVVGSDEVFNHANGVCLQLHGEVPQAKRLISYAASCGSAKAEDILPEDLERVRAAMKRFEALSVRDTATERYVSALCEARVRRHLDPVLVGKLSERKHRPVALKKYIVVYAYGQRIRTDEEIAAIQHFAKKMGLKTVAIGGSQYWCDLYIPASPFRVLDYFYYADYIVTDTFHGAIFSVINQKRFIVLSRRSNYEKVTSLLEDLGLKDRLVSDTSEFERVITAEIAYDKVTAILQSERAKTRQYLKEQLEG